MNLTQGSTKTNNTYNKPVKPVVNKRNLRELWQVLKDQKRKIKTNNKL